MPPPTDGTGRNKRTMKLHHTLITAAMALTLVSCDKRCEIQDAKVEYFPVLLDGETKWGLISPDGEILINAQFDEAPSAVYRNIFSVHEKDGYTMYYADSNPKAVPGCDRLVDAGTFMCDEIAPIVRQGKRISVVNTKGEEQFELTPIDGKEIVASSCLYSSGLLLVKNEDGKWGAVDRKGEVVIPCKYSALTMFNEGYGIATTYDIRDYTFTYQLIDDKGNTVATLDKVKDTRFFMIGGVIPVCTANRMGFVTTDGVTSTCPERVHGISEYNGTYYTFFNYGGAMGLMDGNKLKFKGQYLAIWALDNDMSRFVALDTDNEYKIINRDNETIKKLDYTQVTVLRQSHTILAKDGDYWTILDHDGDVVDKKLAIKSFSEKDYLDAIIRSDYKKSAD